MKKCKLLKELPLAKEGTIVEVDNKAKNLVRVYTESNNARSGKLICQIEKENISEWLEEIPQKPKSIWDLKKGDTYFYTINDTVYEVLFEDFDGCDGDRVLIGNSFLSEKEALKYIYKQLAIGRIKKYCWENSIELADKDFITNVGNTKNYIFYDIKEHKFFSGCFNYSMEYSTFYLKRKEDAEEIIDNCEEDLKIIFNI